MYRSIKYILLIIFIPFFLTAQEDLPTEEVEVIKEFDARLADTDKLEILADEPLFETERQNLVYSIPTRSLSIDYMAPTIKPLAMRRDRAPEVYNNYLKLGYGLPSSPYARFSHFSNIGGEHRFRANIMHHSANFPDIENQRFSETKGNIGGTYFFSEGFALDANFGYTNDNIYYYGYDQGDTTFTKDEAHQQYKIYDFNARFFNGENDRFNVNYAAGLDFYKLNDLYDNAETGLNIYIDFDKWFNETHPLKIRLGTDFTKLTLRDTLKLNLDNFYLNPTFTYHGNAFKARIGANLVAVDDDFSFFPDIEIAANIVGNKLSAYAGAKGDFHKNTYRRLTDYNPYLNWDIDLMNSKYYDVYGGVKGSTQGIEYQVQVGYKPTENLALFLSDSTDLFRRFDLIFDTVDITYIRGSVQASLFGGFELGLTLTNNLYSPENQEKAWHLPSFTTNITARYTTLENRLIIRGDAFIENGVPYINSMGEADNLNGLFDLSFSVDYLFAENFGLFFQLNNLADNKRERWQNYPMYGINILGGITARF